MKAGERRALAGGWSDRSASCPGGTSENSLAFQRWAILACASGTKRLRVALVVALIIPGALLRAIRKSGNVDWKP
jgi:hypothetical protein